MIFIPGFYTRFLYQVSILKQKEGTGTEVYGNDRIDFLTVENVFNHVNRAFLSEERDYFREGKEGFDRFGNLSDSALQHCEVLSGFLYRGNPEKFRYHSADFHLYSAFLCDAGKAFVPENSGGA